MEGGTRSGRPSAVAVFGPFRLDLSTRELSKNGLTLPLEEQPAQVLSFLIERAGVLVSRDDLRQLLWPNGVHVDYEHGVNKSINKLRTVLGDDPDAHGEVHVVLADAVGRAHRQEYLLRADGRILRVRHFREQDHEFIAPLPADGVRSAHAIEEPLRHGLQQAVADDVAEGIVDVLEAIPVQE